MLSAHGNFSGRWGLTPDIQYWSTDGATDRGTHAWVGGLRLDFEF